MEEAIFIAGTSDLNGWSPRYSRIYFGNEFCRGLIPSREELAKVMDFVLSNNLGFTFVTGFATDADINYLKDLLSDVSLRLPGSEIVVNDWGFLNVAGGYKLTPVIGRLLSKQRRDPRILNLMRKLPQKAADCLKSSGGGPYLRRLLHKKSVNRLEIDNLPQGIILNGAAIAEGFKYSLYFPFNYVATSRECPFNNGRLAPGDGRPAGCGRKCRGTIITLKHRTMPLPLYMKGNTIFIENRNIPESLSSKGIDRIVYQYGIPM